MKIFSALGVFFLAGSLAFGAGPKILTQPKALTINAGSTATFTVVATNAVGYQWQYKTNNLVGETNASLLMENVSTNQAGAYRVLVTGAAGKTISTAVKLTVVQGTLVQFNIAGTNVVVELFDHDKPVTVQNFLYYVKAGLFTNTFFHRLVPSYVLQGGGYATVDRSNAIFSTNSDVLLDVYKYALTNVNRYLPQFLLNEYEVGPRIRNEFGTLAMAKLDGYDYAVGAQWFFNLVDNSAFLDTNAGGFAVFGRVIQGAATLEYFNTFTNGAGITNLSDVYTNTGGVFSELPFKTNETISVKCDDLFYANISLLTKPTGKATSVSVKQSNLKNAAILTNGTFSLGGTFSTNIAWLTCEMIHYPITTNENPTYIYMDVDINPPYWTLSVTNYLVMNQAKMVQLEPGAYDTYIFVWDAFGNLYYKLVNQFTVAALLSVNTEGVGKVLNNLDGRYLEIGKATPTVSSLKKYTMTAVPEVGQLFIGWTGIGKTVYTPKITFNMTTNLVLTATFVTNNFPKVTGNYNGLFAEENDGTNVVQAKSAGCFNVTTTSSGGYSGKLQYAGKTISFSGVFDYTGHSLLSVKEPGTTNRILIDLSLDLTNNTGMIYGFVQNTGWISSLLGYRSGGKLSAATVPMPGKYKLTIPGVGGFANTNGTASIVASASGAVSVSGKLADKSALNESVVVSKEGRWPVYESYTKGTGVLWGWETFGSNTCSGVLHWIRPATSGDNGFSVDVIAVGK